jgi:hypothetical protein
MMICRICASEKALISEELGENSVKNLQGEGIFGKKGKCAVHVGYFSASV